jgi:hypothetical protein
MGFTGYMDMGALQLDSVDGLKKASQHFLDKSKIMKLSHRIKYQRLMKVAPHVVCAKKYVLKFLNWKTWQLYLKE